MNNYKEQIKNMKEIEYNELAKKLLQTDLPIKEYEWSYIEKMFNSAEASSDDYFDGNTGYYKLQFEDLEIIKVMTFNENDEIIDEKYYI